MTATELVGRSKILGAHSPIPKSVVKSAGRVMQIMEFFDDVRRAASAVEISSSLGYPQSSTSMLLRSMSEMGYLYHDPQTRTYLPSSRMALAGAWLNDSLVKKGALLELMEELHERTELAVLLSMRRGIFSQYIHIVQAARKAAHLILGTKRYMSSTGTGCAILSTLPDKQVQRVVMSINADAGSAAVTVKLQDVFGVVNQIRQEGYLRADNPVSQGASIAMPLPGWKAESTLAIAVFGPIELIDAGSAHILSEMRSSIGLYHQKFNGADIPRSA